MRFSQVIAIFWLLTPIIVGVIFYFRKRRWTFLKPFLISAVIGYGLIISSAVVSDVELKARLYELDTNGDGTFTGDEITPEVNRRMMAVSSDTGRAFAPFTGLPMSAIWSALNLGAFSLCVKILNLIKQKCPTVKGAAEARHEPSDCTHC
jgi:hypothetical protein